MKTSSSQKVKQMLWDILEQLPPAQRHQVLDELDARDAGRASQ